MKGEFIDLHYLSRFCKEDRSRMERYVDLYLQGAAAMFVELAAKVEASDAEGLALAAHSLRPQVNYMGAQHLFDLLTTIETEARANGSAACSGMVAECVELNAMVLEELRAWLVQGA